MGQTHSKTHRGSTIETQLVPTCPTSPTCPNGKPTSPKTVVTENPTSPNTNNSAVVTSHRGKAVQLFDGSVPPKPKPKQCKRPWKPCNYHAVPPKPCNYHVVATVEAPNDLKVRPNDLKVSTPLQPVAHKINSGNN